MDRENHAIPLSRLRSRGATLLALAVAAGVLAYVCGFHSVRQVLAVSIFVLIVAATLLFWNFRLAIAFVGITVLLAGNVITIEQMVWSSELSIILFLLGMMILVGVLKDLGLFSWLIQLVISMRRIDGGRFVCIVVILSALLSCVVGEVTSTVIIMALVFQVCDTLKVRPVPFLLISVLATNIGSCGTMIGNPVGILIGSKAGLSFTDFLVWAFPVMLVALVASLGLLTAWYRKEIRALSERLAERRKMQLGLGPLVRIPYRRALGILVGVIVLISLHHPIEYLLGVEKNTILMVTPLAASGILMIWRHERARHYVETEVEWWTLLFFMMLFTVAGSLEHTGITEALAHRFQGVSGNQPGVLIPLVMVMAALGSAFVDNIVFVSAFIPVVRELQMTPLWWAMLFGACFGGNITVIGSTANIVAVGMLEKRYRMKIGFLEWLIVGTVIGVLTCAIAWAALTIMAPHMPAFPSH